MNNSTSLAMSPIKRVVAGRALWRRRWLPCVVLLASFSFAVGAQQSGAKLRGPKLPAPDKIVESHLKAIGGKKAQASIRDATYEWSVRRRSDESGQEHGATAGRARIFEKFPGSTRADIMLEDGELNSAANARSAWARGWDGTLRTLTDREAGAAKLSAALAATRLTI